FWTKWVPRRLKHNAFVLSLWACVWLLGTYPLGLPWNEFLAQDPARTWPVLHNVMAFVHHAFPNAVGTLSQRGRFHGWEKVHDAAAEVLHRGLWKPNGDEDRGL
ncbi:unnamed protein product, partial [Symbiodinium pilosum]